jgi:hypothetical protein
MTCRVAKLDPCPSLSTGLNAHLNVAGGRPVHNNQALASTRRHAPRRVASTDTLLLVKLQEIARRWFSITGSL